MRRILIALLLVVGLAGCGGDGAKPVKPPSPDSADPELARAPKAAGEIADPRRPHPRLARALRRSTAATGSRSSSSRPRTRTSTSGGRPRSCSRSTGARGSPGKDSIRVFKTARRTGRKVIEAHGRYFADASFGDFPYVIRLTPQQRVASGRMPDDRTALAAEAFLYGFPLVFNLQQVGRVTARGVRHDAGGAVQPLGARDEARRPGGHVRVRQQRHASTRSPRSTPGPARSAWACRTAPAATTCSSSSTRGRTTSPTSATAPRGPARGRSCSSRPAGRARRTSRSSASRPTSRMIVGRWAVDGEDDLPAVAALQEQLALEPAGDAAGIPDPAPVSRRADLLRGAARLAAGVPAGRARRRLPGALRAARAARGRVALPRRGPGARRRAARRRDRGSPAARGGRRPRRRGAGQRLAADVPRVRLQPRLLRARRARRSGLEGRRGRAARYLRRAVAARAGLWGNHGYEAGYAPVYVDADGEPLDGTRRYALRFDTPPPVGAFWSVTMYDLPEFYLVANPVGRYSIGDRTPGLVTADGRLADDRAPARGARPTRTRARTGCRRPRPPFRPMLRMYEPDAAIFDGGYTLPPITRID